MPDYRPLIDRLRALEGYEIGPADPYGAGNESGEVADLLEITASIHGPEIDLDFVGAEFDLSGLSEGLAHFQRIYDDGRGPDGIYLEPDAHGCRVWWVGHDPPGAAVLFESFPEFLEACVALAEARQATAGDPAVEVPPSPWNDHDRAFGTWMSLDDLAERFEGRPTLRMERDVDELFETPTVPMEESPTAGGATERSLDELFGGGSGQPVPRTGMVVVLLVSGLIMALAGMACSAAPGGLLVLVAWVIVDKELDRIESGYLSTEFKPRVEALQRAVYASVAIIIALFAIQFWLLRNGFYEAFWGGLLGAIRTSAV